MHTHLHIHNPRETVKGISARGRGLAQASGQPGSKTLVTYLRVFPILNVTLALNPHAYLSMAYLPIGTAFLLLTVKTGLIWRYLPANSLVFKIKHYNLLGFISVEIC